MELDKQAHLLAGAAIALALGYLFPIAYCFAAVLVAGAGKEVYDHFHPPHVCDIKDFAATAFGGAVASIFLISLSKELV